MASNSYYNSHPAYIPPPPPHFDDKDEAHFHLLGSPPPNLQEHPAHRDFVDSSQQQHLLSHSSPSPSPGKRMSSGSQGCSQPGRSSGPTSPLKPFHWKAKMDHSHQKHVSQSTSYHGSTGSLDGFEQIQATRKEDEKLKARIRRLRLVTRILALVISVAVFVPITLTLHKYLTTRNVFHMAPSVTGQPVNRTAWAKDSKAWPTYMYFGVALVSLILNFVIIFSYKFGVKYANKAAIIATTSNWIVMAANLIVWSVAASLYRTEKDKGGKSNDLWGWTCSPAAKKIQKEFAGEVDFDRFCNVQSISWYIGLVQVAVTALTICTYIMVYMRRKAKKNLKKHDSMLRVVEAKAGR
ncbi:hypothetical protein K504DRAFT_506007 [Pleomassaria siparia CBS 279.74]|uniref:MARVEL domain-containing protein n=1 Tax=Pleomassaria siparia CBS 279.74 TaxID=1314801 RepID=A0A6G1JZA9_9PLEO|nr:hypothetical protein K504DRAFT_506007 [Pleomassaria siparia CBS 279.74]